MSNDGGDGGLALGGSRDEPFLRLNEMPSTQTSEPGAFCCESYPRGLKITIETNALIDLETESPDAPALRSIADRHGANGIMVAIAGVSASEAKRGGGHEDIFSAFQARLAAARLDHLEILKTGRRVRPLLLGLVHPRGRRDGRP